MLSAPAEKCPMCCHVYSSCSRIGYFGYRIYHDRLETVFNGNPHWVVGGSGLGMDIVIVYFNATEEKFKEVAQNLIVG